MKCLSTAVQGICGQIRTVSTCMAQVLLSHSFRTLNETETSGKISG